MVIALAAPRKVSVPTPGKTEYYYECVCCLKKKHEREFFNSMHSPMWGNKSNKALICKDCINSIVDDVASRFWI